MAVIFTVTMFDGSAKTVINVPEDLFDRENYQSGRTQISYVAPAVGGRRTSFVDSDSVTEYDVIDMSTGSVTIVQVANRANRALSVGQNANLYLDVIRVRNNHGHAPTYTKNQLYHHILGTDGNVAGFWECSGN